MTIERNIEPCPMADELQSHLEGYELGATLISVCTRQLVEAIGPGWPGPPDPAGMVAMKFDEQPDEAALDVAISELP